MIFILNILNIAIRQGRMQKDIVQHMFSLLDTNSILKLRLVCKSWSQIGLLFISQLSMNPSHDDQLKPFKLLTTLHLRHNSAITDAGLQFTPFLTTLDLRYNSMITDA